MLHSLSISHLFSVRAFLCWYIFVNGTVCLFVVFFSLYDFWFHLWRILFCIWEMLGNLVDVMMMIMIPTFYSFVYHIHFSMFFPLLLLRNRNIVDSMSFFFRSLSIVLQFTILSFFAFHCYLSGCRFCEFICNGRVHIVLWLCKFHMTSIYFDALEQWKQWFKWGKWKYFVFFAKRRRINCVMWKIFSLLCASALYVCVCVCTMNTNEQMKNVVKSMYSIPHQRHYKCKTQRRVKKKRIFLCAMKNNWNGTLQNNVKCKRRKSEKMQTANDFYVQNPLLHP